MLIPAACDRKLRAEWSKLEGYAVFIGAVTETYGVPGVHLRPAQARRLARALLKFADGASKPKRKGSK